MGNISVGHVYYEGKKYRKREARKEQLEKS